MTLDEAKVLLTENDIDFELVEYKDEEEYLHHTALDYTQWRNFQKVINRARVACENSGHDSFNDFAEVSKIVDAGATTKPKLDYELTRLTEKSKKGKLMLDE